MGKGGVMSKEVLLSRRGHEVEIGTYLSTLSPGAGLILNMGGALPAPLRERYPGMTAGSCLSVGGALAIDKAASHMAQSWHGGKDGPKYRGISVGDLIAYEVMQWLIATMKHSVIIENLCRKVMPGTLVALDDKSPFVQMISSIARVWGLPVKWLEPATERPRLTPGGRGWLRNSLVASAQWAYECSLSIDNSMKAFLSNFSPGFRRSSGIRCALFDPYVGYELLMPRLLGSSPQAIIIPRPNFRLMSRLHYYQDVFGVPTGYFDQGGSMAGGVTPEKLRGEMDSLAAGLGRQGMNSQTLGFEIPWAALKGPFQDLCTQLIGKACAEIDGAERILRSHKVDATVLPWDELGLYKALTLVGKRDGLLTVRYQHGVVNRYPAFVPPSSEKVLVWDECARGFYRSLGVSEDRLSMLPNPRVPILEAKADQVEKEEVRRRYGLPGSRRMVLFAGTPFVGLSALDHPEEVVKTLENLLDVAGSVPDHQFLVKLHPNDDNTGELGRVQNIVNERNLRNVTVLASCDTQELILASDIVVAETSTCLWEAVVLKRRAIAYLGREFVREIYPYDNHQGVTRFDDPRLLQETLREGVAQVEGPVDVPSPSFVGARNYGEHGYYDDPRWELLSLIPSGTRRMLDVGCGTGRLGRQVKTTRPCLVVGIERNEDAAKKAREILDEVLIEDVDGLGASFQGGEFNCIVFGDVLEHLPDPWETLKWYARCLRDDGVVVLSIPNVGHYKVLLSLAGGRWEYEEEGIVDRTHLRFFTRAGVESLLEQAGLRIVRMARNTDAGRKMRIANFLSGNRLEDLVTFQYLIVAKRQATESAA